MHCDGCAQAITEAVQAVPGVVGMRQDPHFQQGHHRGKQEKQPGVQGPSQRNLMQRTRFHAVSSAGLGLVSCFQPNPELLLFALDRQRHLVAHPMTFQSVQQVIGRP
jgi:hypothetical protein